MYCKKCGTEQKNGQKFCPKCGTPFVTLDNDFKVQNDSPHASSDIGDDRIETPSSYEGEEPMAKKQQTIKYVVLASVACLAIGLGFFLGWNHLKDAATSIMGSKEEFHGEIDGIPFKTTENGKWGMLRPDGTILFENEFKDEPTLARNGRFMVKNGNKLWEIYTATENPQKVGDEYVSIGDFNEGVAPAVQKNGKITLINKDGNVLSELDKSGSKHITRMENFHYGYALFETDEAVGIVNTRGEILLDANKYCKIYHVAPNRFLALDMRYKDETDKHNYVYQVIDANGNQKNQIRMAKYDDIAVFADGYIGIEQSSDGEKLYGIMNLDGDVLVRPTRKIQGLAAYKNGKFIYSDGENMGVRTIKDEVIIRPKYDAIFWATDDLLWVCSADDGRQQWSLVDLQGRKLTSDTYQTVTPFFDNKNSFVQITDKTWGVVNSSGEELKGVPDIYAISQNTADVVIESDYVDMNAIVSAVNMTPVGFGGLGMNMKPIDLIKVYNEYCNEADVIKLDPNETHIDRLSYTKEILKNVKCRVELYYSGYISEQGEERYDSSINEWIKQPAKWTDKEPQYIRVTISGEKMTDNDKTKLLYKKLVVKAKTFGKIYKETDNACIVIINNKYGMVLYNTGTDVNGKIMSVEAMKHENISSYDNSFDGEIVDTTPIDSDPVDTAAVFDDMPW